MRRRGSMPRLLHGRISARESIPATTEAERYRSASFIRGRSLRRRECASSRCILQATRRVAAGMFGKAYFSRAY